MPAPIRSKKPSALFITGIIEILLGIGTVYLLFSSGHTQLGLFYAGSFLLFLAFGKKIGWGKVQIIASIYIGFVLLFVLGFIFVLYIITGSGYSNKAQDNITPILSQITSLGAKEICTAGDNGHTLDNTQPWYTIEYLIPHSGSLANSIMQIAESNGFPLSVNTELINSLKNTPYSVNQQDNETYNPRVYYLIGEKGSDNLSVTIYPLDTYQTTKAEKNDGSDCIDGYKQQIRVLGSNSDVISINSDLPDPKLSVTPSQ